MDITKTELFVKEMISRLTGDSDQAFAAKQARLAYSALQGQINALNGKLVNDELALEEAQENYEKAIYPTVKISEAGSYSRGILQAKNAVTTAEDNLKNTQDSLKVFQDIIDTKF